MAWSLSEAFENERCKALVLQFNTDCRLIKDLAGKLTYGFIPGGGTNPVKALYETKIKLDEIRQYHKVLKPLIIILTDALYPVTDSLTEAVETLRNEDAKIVEVKIPNDGHGANIEYQKYAKGRERAYDYVYNIDSPDEIIHNLQEVLVDIEKQIIRTDI